MFQRILLAVDSGDTGSVASSFTVALARSCGARVHVVHVNEYLIGGRGLTNESPAEAAGMVADAMKEMHDAGVPATGVTYRTTHFDVAPAIADVAEEWRADVVVVGSRRRRLGASLRQAMREKIARQTPLPVLTAPAPLRVAARDRTFQAPLPVRLPGTTVVS